MQRGLTLVELVVATALAGIVGILVLAFTIQGERRSRELDHQLQALRCSVLLRAHLADDIAACIASRDGKDVSRNAHGITIRRVRAGDDKGIFDTCLDEDLAPVTETVEYYFDEPGQRILRNGRSIGGACYSEVSFEYHPLEEGLGGEIIEVITVVDEETSPVRHSFHCPNRALRKLYDDYALGRK